MQILKTIFAVIAAGLTFLAYSAYKLFTMIPVPSGPPTPNDPPPANDPVADAILGYNNGLAYFQTASVWEIPGNGVIVHKINATTASAISVVTQANAKQSGLPLTYILGCLAIESTLDPNCQNGNLGPGESNQGDPSNLGGYDMGLAQLKLKYLSGQPNVTNVTAAEAFAFDISKAVPYFCGLMNSHLAWAKTTIQYTQDYPSSDVSPDPRMLNPYILATAAYNFGETGVMTYYNNGQFPSHCQQVEDLEKYFAGKLGVASIFADLQGAS